MLGDGEMTLKKISILMLISLMVLSSFTAMALPTNLNQQANAEKTRAEKIIWIADSAKRRVEVLINITLANATVLEMINSTGLNASLQGNLTLFNEGVILLENATDEFNNGNYENATIYAIEALKVFRDVFRNINRILCQANVKKGEIIDAQGLLQAMNRALLRIEKIRELMNRSQIENETITQTLEEAKQLLNITEAISMLQQGNVTRVAHNLAEANRLIAQATQMLKNELRQKLIERIEHFKAMIRQRIEKIKERLQKMNMTGKDLLGPWGFKSMEEFRGKIIEIINRTRDQIRAGNWTIVGNLKAVGRWMHRLSFALERRIREHEGGGAAFANLTINIIKIVRWQHRVVLVIRVENRGNMTLLFPNSVFGITVEKRVGKSWKLYYSPPSLQVLTPLKSGEFRILKIGFNVAGHGAYRVVVRASAEETGWFEKYVEFKV